MLTGRHGLFNCYEAFIHIVDFDVQPARQVAEGHVAPAVAAEDCLLTYLLASHVWRQDHNGFTHQDSGFIDHVVQAEVVVFTFPPTPTAYCR